MKKLFLFLLVIILLVGTVSAFEFDNIMTYDEETRTVDVRNSVLGIPFLGLDKISEVQLITPHINFVFPGKDRLVAEFRLELFLNYKKPLDKIEFFNLNNNMDKIDRKFTYKYKSFYDVEVDDYDWQCGNVIDVNGSYKDCKWVKNGTTIKRDYNWVELTNDIYNSNDEYYIGIFTDVQKGDYVEWIPTFFNVKINEWALWTDNLNVGLIGAWSFTDDESGGSVVEDLSDVTVDGTFNGSVGWVEGKNQMAVENFSTSDFIGIPYRDDFNVTEYTVSTWVYLNSSHTNSSYAFQTILANNFSTTAFNLGISGNRTYARTGNDADGCRSQPLIGEVNKWYNIVYVKNNTVGSNTYFYVDGVKIDNEDDVYCNQNNMNFSTSPFVLGGGRGDGCALQGRLDEVYFWNRTLSDAEIVALNDSFYIDSLIKITLNKPVENFVSPINSVEFNCSASYTGGATISNISLWTNETGVFLEQNITTGFTGTNESATWFRSYNDGESVSWNCRVCTSTNICEYGISNRTFNIDLSNPLVTINSPGTRVGSGIVGGNITLNWSIDETNVDTINYNYNGTNVTLYGLENSTTFTTINSTDRSLWLWVNDSAGRENITSVTWVYNVWENAQTYNSTTTELSSENFKINVNLTSSDWIGATANLIYNGTSYLGTKSGSGNNLIFSRLINIPTFNSFPANATFYWEFLFTNSSGTSKFNSSDNNQTISELIFTRCNSTYNSPVVVNYTIYNESSLSLINASFDASFVYWVGDTNLNKNYFLSAVSNTTFQFCTNSNETYYVDAIINLESEGYNERTYYFNNVPYNNVITETHLYMLNTTLETNVIVQVKDSGLNPLKGYYVTIERYYPELHAYKKVIVAETDEYGQFVVKLIENTVKYKFTFKDRNNVVQKTTGDMTIACRAIICILPFVIEDTTDDFERFDNLTDYDWVFSFDNVTNMFSFIWADTRSESATTWLKVERRLFNGTNVLTVGGCNSTSTATSGSLTCSVGDSDASYSAQVFRRVSGETNWRRISSLLIKVGITFQTYGKEGLVWSFFLLMTAIAVGYYFPPAGLILYGVLAFALSYIEVIYVNPAILIAQFLIVGLFCWAFGGKK